MDGSINKTQKCTPTTDLPHEIIENILSRLPVKSLFRFKAVSKQWKTTISDPEFAEVHLQQSKNSSSCQNLLAWEADEFRGFSVVKLENERFQALSAIEYPWEEDLELNLLCYCDGLYLKYYDDVSGKMYVLWNPSTRTYKRFSCPYPIYYPFKTILYGLFYDPLMKDYKVVIADMKHYAIFSCRNNTWTVMKEMEEFSCSSDEVVYCDGVHFNGSFYWVVTTKRIQEGFSHRYGFEIVCFDWRDERFVELPTPHCEEDDVIFNYLASLRGHLSLFLFPPFARRHEIRIMQKVGDEVSWIELKVRLPFSCPDVMPLCLTNENEIILDVGDPEKYVLYSESKKSFAEIPKSSTTVHPWPVPYQENLFLL